MNHSIILVAETGSDLPAEIAAELGVFLVPMHVSMGSETLDDGTFPPSRIFDFYEQTKTAPKTSASIPADFNKVFDEIHARWPEKQILHLAYSAVTTCSYQSAILAAEGRDYVTSVDTRHVSVGQAIVVKKVRQYLDSHPDCTIAEAVQAAEEISRATHMCFIPRNLDYLRAGGRVSNSVALVGNLLGLHPCIQIEEGKLMARKKYRGKLPRIIEKLMQDFVAAHNADYQELNLIFSPGLSEESKAAAEETARKLGFARISWWCSGGVITCHGGPGCFGMVVSELQNA